MTLPNPSTERLMSIYLALAQYPVLAGRIRAQMRRELFERGAISPQAFERDVRQKAIESQQREGLHNPWSEEPADVWEFRVNAIRDQLTDFHFSYYLPFDLFEGIVGQVLRERGLSEQSMLLAINPELAPMDLLFEQAFAIERMPAGERARMEPRLHEIKVVLIRTLISDQLRYINIAKEWLSVSDLADIRRHKIAGGRIGGKAAGMMLALRIIKDVADEDLRNGVVVPESYFLGSDLLYTFMSTNDLVHWNDQKYKSETEMRQEYPLIQKDFEKGEFPPEIVDRLREVLETIGSRPIIVRSSSLLEDNFGTSFAGKYDSIFCPNQGSLKQNLRDLTRALANIYASVLNPNALLYRRSKGLQDYDERMGVLLQEVQGETFGRYFMPNAAGVAFSHNQFRWAPQIRREDGFVRLVWGLGTRAVDRVGNDYPRLVALSHPLLRPSTTARSIRRYSQQYVDLIDLESNSFQTLAVHDVLRSRYPPLRYLAQMDEDGYFSSLRTNLVEGDNHNLILTFEEFLRRTPFAERMRDMLQLLEKRYHAPVDLEFTAQIVNPEAAHPEVIISLLQCRPQAQLMEAERVNIPPNLNPADIIFSTNFMVPEGQVDGIRYVVFVPHENYFAMPTQAERYELGREIGRLNAALKGQTFICVGPGRWGTSNADLGVHIDYGDIYNSRALVEVAGLEYGLAPEPSLGTHFYQDLLEAQIFPLAIFMEDAQSIFNRAFFYETPNCVTDWIKPDARSACCLKLIDVHAFRADHHLKLVMDNNKNQAVAYLLPDSNTDESMSIAKALARAGSEGNDPGVYL